MIEELLKDINSNIIEQNGLLTQLIAKNGGVAAIEAKTNGKAPLPIELDEAAEDNDDDLSGDEPAELSLAEVQDAIRAAAGKGETQKGKVKAALAKFGATNAKTLDAGKYQAFVDVVAKIK